MAVLDDLVDQDHPVVHEVVVGEGQLPGLLLPVQVRPLDHCLADAGLGRPELEVPDFLDEHYLLALGDVGGGHWWGVRCFRVVPQRLVKGVEQEQPFMIAAQ